MAVGGEQLICGLYTATWNSVALGIHLGDEGLPAIGTRPIADPVDNTDRYGKVKIDAVHMGHLYWYEAVMLEYPKAIGVYSPFGAFGTIGTIGLLKYSAAKPLVLTVVADGTTAVGNPNTLTAPKAMFADDFQGKLFFGPKLRTVPIKMDLYPSAVANDGSMTVFTTT